MTIDHFSPHFHQCSRHQIFQYVCFVNFELDDPACTLGSLTLKSEENCFPDFLSKDGRFHQTINELVEADPKASLGLISRLKFLPSLLLV